jgi:hypothetical protein
MDATASPCLPTASNGSSACVDQESNHENIGAFIGQDPRASTTASSPWPGWLCWAGSIAGTCWGFTTNSGHVAVLPHASIYHVVGIPPKLAYEIEQRPFYVTRDGLCKPVEGLFG